MKATNIIDRQVNRNGNTKHFNDLYFQFSDINILKLGGVGVQGQVKGSGWWECKLLNSTIGWQHAKVKSMKMLNRN